MQGLVLFVCAIFCLWFGRSLLIPLLIATFFWYLINALSAYYRRILPCYKKNNSCDVIQSKTFMNNSEILDYEHFIIYNIFIN